MTVCVWTLLGIGGLRQVPAGQIHEWMCFFTSDVNLGFVNLGCVFTPSPLFCSQVKSMSGSLSPRVTSPRIVSPSSVSMTGSSRMVSPSAVSMALQGSLPTATASMQRCSSSNNSVLPGSVLVPECDGSRVARISSTIFASPRASPSSLQGHEGGVTDPDADGPAGERKFAPLICLNPSSLVAHQCQIPCLCTAAAFPTTVASAVAVDPTVTHAAVPHTANPEAICAASPAEGRGQSSSPVAGAVGVVGAGAAAALSAYAAGSPTIRAAEGEAKASAAPPGPRSPLSREGSHWASLFDPDEADVALTASLGQLGKQTAVVSPAAGQQQPQQQRQHTNMNDDQDDDDVVANLPSLPDSVYEGEGAAAAAAVPAAGPNGAPAASSHHPTATGLSGLLSAFTRPKRHVPVVPQGGEGNGEDLGVARSKSVVVAGSSRSPFLRGSLPLPKNTHAAAATAPPPPPFDLHLRDASSSSSPHEAWPYLLGGTAIVITANERAGIPANTAAPGPAFKGKVKIWRPESEVLPVSAADIPEATVAIATVAKPTLPSPAPADIPSFLRPKPAKPKRLKRGGGVGSSEPRLEDMETVEALSSVTHSQSATKQGRSTG